MLLLSLKIISGKLKNLCKLIYETNYTLVHTDDSMVEYLPSKQDIRVQFPVGVNSFKTYFYINLDLLPQVGQRLNIDPTEEDLKYI